MTNETLIAVYGTLRQGNGNHNYFLRKDPVSTIEVPGFKMYSLFSFPGIKRASDSDTIVAELYWVNDEELSSINGLEGYTPGSNNNSFYDRISIDTELGPAYIYLYLGGVSEDNLIESGDWNDRNTIEAINYY